MIINGSGTWIRPCPSIPRSREFLLESRPRDYRRAHYSSLDILGELVCPCIDWERRGNQRILELTILWSEDEWWSPSSAFALRNPRTWAESRILQRNRRLHEEKYTRGFIAWIWTSRDHTAKGDCNRDRSRHAQSERDCVVRIAHWRSKNRTNELLPRERQLSKTSKIKLFARKNSRFQLTKKEITTLSPLSHYNATN